MIAQEKYFLKTNESNASPWFEESITGHLEIQTQDVYDNELFVGVTDIMCLAYRIGVLFTPF